MIWLLLMMLFPAKLSLLKYIILTIILFLNISNRDLRKTMPVKLLIGIVLFLAISVMGLSISLYLNYTLRFKHIDIYILRPLYMLIFINNIRTEQDIKHLIKGIVNIIFIISIYDFIYCFGELGIIPQMMFWENNNTSITIIENGFLTCRLLNITSFLFGLPVIYCLYFTGQSSQYAKKVKFIITMVLGTTVGMLSGRRVLQVVILASFFGCIFYKIIKNRRRIKKSSIHTMIAVVILTIVGMVVLQYKLGVDSLLKTIVLTIKDAFVNANSENSPRKIQVKVLLECLNRYPVFGTGLGSFINGRDVLEYEYQYLAYLAEVGLVGMSVYVFILFGIVVALLNGAKSKKFKTINHCYTAILYGAFWFFVAGSTNPMIVSTWFWIPVLAFYQANYVLGYRDRQQELGCGGRKNLCREKSCGFH